MAIDETLAGRVREALAGVDGLTEKRMFGGLAFLLNGNMCCGVHGDDLIVRLDPEQTDEAIRTRHVRAFDLAGRPLRGWVLVGPEAVGSEAALRAWTDRGSAFARGLPPK